MSSNRKLIIYASIVVLILSVVSVVLFIKLFHGSNVVEPKIMMGSRHGNKSELEQKEQEQQSENILPMLHAVPTDAIFVLNVNKGAKISKILRDSTGYISKTLEADGVANAPWIISMHYSAKNSVSMLYILDLNNLKPEDVSDKILKSGKLMERNYNGIKIYSLVNNFYFAVYDKLFMASASPFVLESSIRHLIGKVSILDNKDFVKINEKYKGDQMLYLNHHQIGKLFSGTVDRGFLKYSDFFLKFSHWTALNLEEDESLSSLSGYLLNNKDLKNYSSLFCSQEASESNFAEIIPASAVFVMSINVFSLKNYINSLSLFMEVHKRLSSYNLKQSQLAANGRITPIKLMDSIKLQSITSAYCKFGDSYYWLSFIKVKPKGFIKKTVEKMFGKEPNTVKKYPYSGYLASVFGDLFAYCNEESYCVIDDWWVIGPKKLVNEFVSNDACYYSLADYLNQGPASGFLSKSSGVKLYINALEGRDTVASVFKYPLKWELLKTTKDNNFVVTTMDIFQEDDELKTDINIYTEKLKNPPMPKTRERHEGDVGFGLDSIINVPKGPYKIIDFVNGGSCYLEQNTNNKLSYLSASKKRVWTVDFKAPICGMVAQADLFKNEKLQMVFVSGSKLYALDRLGRFVGGFPVQLKKDVALGPMLVDLKGDKDYSVVVINMDNTISIYNLRSGEFINGWKDIKCKEFIKNLPSVIRVNERWYLALRTSVSLRFYDMNGLEIVSDDENKIISPNSFIREGGGNDVVVKGVDGKNFVINLSNGNTKKYKKK